MCGIAGIIGRVNPKHAAALRRMANAMCHRGPDAEGFWTSPSDEGGFGCLLAHRRLSILDLSHAADQPMTDPAGGQTIIFNGEIYNYRELRAELEGRGERFDSSGDTAVMLRKLALEGEAALPALRGMFAFALWDPKKRELLLARDPLGIKPLYICRNPESEGEWSLLFSSEVRAILASGLLESPKLNPAAVASVVWNGFVMGPQTIVQGVESLRPGEFMRLGARGERIGEGIFWSLSRKEIASSPATEEQLYDTLRQTVRQHLSSDVPLGIFLSSGIDSSAVANLAAREAGAEIHTFTLAFEEAAYNEAGYARQIAEAIGSSHQEVMLTESMFTANLERAVDTLDQPTFDGLNSFYMARAVREAGFTVALVGTGGDELFGGYTSFRDLPAMARWNGRFGFLPESLRVAPAKLVRRLLAGGAGAVPPQTRWAKLPEMVRANSDLLALYQLAYALFLPDFQRELLAGGIDPLEHGMPHEMQQRLREETMGRTRLSAISVLEQRCFLGERLLRDTDAASMAVSLEIRLPLVDHLLTEQVDRLADSLRYHPVGRKEMLRRVGLRGLDPKLFERPKSGFVLPFDAWIRKGLGKEMEALMNDAAAVRAVGLEPETVSRLWRAFQEGSPGLYWSRVWAIYVLIRWWSRHGGLKV